MSETHRTEAACLLEQGALYPLRVGLRAPEGDLILAAVKPGGFSLYFGDAPIYHFDLEGRWQRAYIGERHFLKGLDGSVHALDRVRDQGSMVLKRRRLEYAAAVELDALARATASELARGVMRAEYEFVPPPGTRGRALSGEALLELLDRITRWDSAAWFAQRERFVSACLHDEFLPPECSGAVIVPATRGAASGLAFAHARQAPAWSADAEEFEHIALGVKQLWGLRLRQAKTLYVAGSDFYKQSVEIIADRLAAAARVFPIRASGTQPRDAARPDPLEPGLEPALEGIHGFLDDYAEPRPSRADWARFATLGLKRMSLGVESGDPATRALYGKSWLASDLAQVVSEIKAAGVAISLLVLAGAGGDARALPHREQTAALLDSLELGAGDHVFLLDEREIRDPGAAEGLEPIDSVDRARDEAAFKQALAFLKDRRVKVLPYTFEKQLA